APADWLALAGYAGAASLIDADVSTVSAAADKVIRVRGRPDWLLHWEAQTGPDRTLPERLHLYSQPLRHRHAFRVRSVALLLRPGAKPVEPDGGVRGGVPGRAALFDLPLRGDPRVATAGRAAAGRWRGDLAAGPDQRGEEGGAAGRDRTDEGAV